MKPNNLLTKILAKMPLKFVFIVPFVLQILGTVGIVGYLSFQNGQKAVQELFTQLEDEITLRIDDNLTQYLHSAEIVNQNNLDLITLQKLDFENVDNWEQYLWQNIQKYSNVAVIGLANNQGEYRASQKLLDHSIILNTIDPKINFNFNSYHTDNQGNKTKLIKITKNIDIRQRPWYQDAIHEKKAVWSTIHPAIVEDILLISHAIPVDQNNDQIDEGVLMTTLSLENLGEFLKSLKIGKTGQVFLIDHDGNLVATSTEEPLFTVEKNEKNLINIIDSTQILTSFTGKHLKDHFGNLQGLKNTSNLPLKIADKKYFLTIKSYQNQEGLDWQIILLIPESDFMEQININTFNTIITCILALIIAIFLGIITANYVIKPILQLNESAKKIAQGNWENIEIDRQDELGELANSFNNMAFQVKESFENLEKKVIERTYELEIAKEKAEVANKAKSSFIANMSHELRTPLNAVLGFSQIMIRSQDLSKEHRENTTIIYKSGSYLLNLINNILDLSKIEADKMILNSQNFDFYSFLEDLEDLLSITAENRGLKLIFDYQSNVPQYISTDEIKLRQVLINLINNGIKFTKKGGVSLTVGSKNINEEKAIIIFEIRDTGEGISDDEIPTLFEAFTQTKTGKNSQEGTGLGLPISRKFVNLMGGDIKVKSEIEIGTTFSFEIEVDIVSKNEVESKSITRNVIALQPNQPRYKILIVDDRPTNRLLLIKLLQPLGFELKEAENGQEAITIWDSWNPHLIWMDMRMPIMDGYEATQQIKGTTKGNATAIIALTASVLEEEKAIILSAGCDDFVRKPFRESTIFDTMAKHLGIEYIYEEENQANEEGKSSILTAEKLKLMPKEWLEKVYFAVKALDDDMMIKLIEEIPEDHHLLANQLTRLVNDFQFKTIRQLLDSFMED